MVEQAMELPIMELVALVVEDTEGVFWEASQVLEQECLESVVEQAMEQEQEVTKQDQEDSKEQEVTKQEQEEVTKQEQGLEAHRRESSPPPAGNASKYE